MSFNANRGRYLGIFKRTSTFTVLSLHDSSELNETVAIERAVEINWAAKVSLSNKNRGGRVILFILS